MRVTVTVTGRVDNSTQPSLYGFLDDFTSPYTYAQLPNDTPFSATFSYDASTATPVVGDQGLLNVSGVEFENYRFGSHDGLILPEYPLPSGLGLESPVKGIALVGLDTQYTPPIDVISATVFGIYSPSTPQSIQSRIGLNISIDPSIFSFSTQNGVPVGGSYVRNLPTENATFSAGGDIENFNTTKFPYVGAAEQFKFNGYIDSISLGIGSAPPPDLGTLASLASAVYDGTQASRGYHQIPFIESSSGFLGEGFQNENQIVIAFRGTYKDDQITLLKNTLADTSFGTGVATPTLQKNVLLAAQLVAEVRTAYPNADITLTGHSLGGAIAQLVGEESGFKTDVFNAPGSQQLFAQLSRELSSVHALASVPSTENANYRIAGDQISFFGTPVGSTFTIQSDEASSWANLPYNHYLSTVVSLLGEGRAETPGFTDAPLANLEVPTYVGGVASFVFNIASSAIEYGLDPQPAMAYELGETLGSPQIASLTLPRMPDVYAYEVSLERDGLWGEYQTFQPGVAFGGLPFDGAKFYPVDIYDNQLMIADSAIFSTTFSSAGTFRGTITTIPCFCMGTRIKTPRGEAQVESLIEGDWVTARFAGSAPVRWIGHRHIDCLRHPEPHRVWPIRITAGAFGPSLPQNDLWLSPDHMVFVDGLLVAAKQLVNGTTITQEPRDEVTYFHIELDHHDILLAEGIPAESYLDTGNRAEFENAGTPMVLHPDFSRKQRIVSREHDSCAPLAATPNEVEPIWQRLAARAANLGHPASLPAATRDPQFRLSVAGRDIQPITASEDQFIFVLPPRAQSARLISRAAAPSDTRPWLEDCRRLGIAVGRIVLDNGMQSTAIPPDHPSLTDGWHDAERDGERLWRWTDGNAQLALPAGTRMVEIHLAGSTEYPIETAANAQVLAA